MTDQAPHKPIPAAQLAAELQAIALAIRLFGLDGIRRGQVQFPQNANRDGECYHVNCPQLRDGEPKKTGRHCPIDTWDEDDG